MSTSSTEVHPSIHLDDSSPAAPSGRQNVTWQIDEGVSPADVSASVPNDGGVVIKTASYTAVAADDGLLIVMNGSGLTLTLPSTPPSAKWRIWVANINASSASVSPNGLNIDGGTSNIALTTNQGFYISTEGTNYFSNRGLGSGSSGGSLPAGSPIVLGGTISSANTNWKNFTLRAAFRHSALLNAPSSWKIRLCAVGGTGMHISKCQVKRTLKNSTAVVDSHTITFNGGSSSYNFAFGVTASLSAPVYLDSDAISAVGIDIDHDYWIYVYFDDDSAGSNFNVTLGLNSWAPLSAAMQTSNDTSGDQTSETTVPTLSTDTWIGLLQVFSA